MTRTAEQQARRLLWLFPAWVRADRGEEVLGLVLDQVPAGAARLPLRSRLDLVRAGLQVRRRATPPPWVLFEVLTASDANARGRVPDRWRAWLGWFALAPRWNRRQIAASVAPVIALVVLLYLGGVLADPNGFGLVFAGIWLSARRHQRRSLWQATVLGRNALAAPVPASSSYAVADGPARRALGRAALACGAVAVLAAVAGAVLGYGGAPVHLAFAVLAGGAGIVAARWLARRGLASVPAQPVVWQVHDRRVDRWTLRLAALVVSGIVVASGWNGAVLALLVTVGCLVLRHGAAVRSRQLGREISLWEACPFVGPGATLTPPPEAAA